jgi:hypothetical protein
MSKTIPLTFYSLKEQKVISFKDNTTLKQIKDQISKEMKIDSKKIGSTIFLIYNGLKLNLTSNDKIANKFKDNNKIFVINKGEDITIEKILSNKNPKAASANNNNNNNIKKDDDKKVDKKEDKKDDSKEDNNPKVNEILEQMVILGYKEKKKIEDIKKNLKNKIISIDNCINTGDDNLLVIALLAKYLEEKNQNSHYYRST